jgi:hypothetical protein
MFISAMKNPTIWLNDYPPAIKEKYGPLSNEAKKEAKPYIILFVLVILILIFGVIIEYKFIYGENSDFINLLGINLIIVHIFNVWDLLLIDWLFWVRIQPKFIILPGTEGMKEYKDYIFHLKKFLHGIFLVSILAFFITVVEFTILVIIN